MPKKLSECASVRIERGHAAIDLTINSQRGLNGVAMAAVPALIEELSEEMETLTRVLSAEAEGIADAAESAACELDGVPGGEIVARHYDSRNFAVNSNGSKVYARIEITSVSAIARSVLMCLTEEFLACFWEFILERIMDAENGAASVVDRPGMLGAQAVLAALPGSDEPQPGDRA